MHMVSLLLSAILLLLLIVLTAVMEARVIDGTVAMDLLGGDSALKQSQSKHFANVIPQLLFHHYTEKDNAIDWFNVPESVPADDSEYDFRRMHTMIYEMIISQLGSASAVEEPAIFCDPLYPHRIENIAFTPRILRVHYETNECRNLVLNTMRRKLAEKREECRYYSCVPEKCPPTIKWCDSPILGLLPVLPDQVPELLTMTDQKNENRKQQREFVLRHKLAERTKKRTRYGLNSIKKMLIGGGKLAEKFSNEFQQLSWKLDSKTQFYHIGFSKPRVICEQINQQQKTNNGHVTFEQSYEDFMSENCKMADLRNDPARNQQNKKDHLSRRIFL